MQVRLQKFIAGAGVAARRKAEGLISAGRVTVNDRVVTELGSKVDPRRDQVRVDGKLLLEAEAPVYLVFYKPAGVLSAMEDARGIPVVADFVKNVGSRVFPVGRLDYSAEGAVLLTNDGDLSHKLTHGRRAGLRVYLAKVRGEPDEKSIALLRNGVRLEDGIAVAEVRVEGRAEKNTWLKFVLDESRRDLVRRMCAAVGHPASRVFRPEFAGIRVEGLSPGEWRVLGSEEARHLKEVAAGRREVVPSRSPTLPPRIHGRPNRPDLAGRGRIASKSVSSPRDPRDRPRTEVKRSRR